MTNPLVSIAIPVYNMENKDFFLKRCVDSIHAQSFKDYEIVITEEGAMAKNTNAAIKASKGDIIKVLYMDDYFAHKNALQAIVDAFKGGWLVTACNHDDGRSIHNKHYADMNPNIHVMNTIGSPSVLTIENNDPIFMDESLKWMLDGEYYKRLYERYGNPVILDDVNVTIGLHSGQATNILSDEIKNNEYETLRNKYGI